MPALERLFYPATALLLLIMGFVQVASVRQESPTYDEGTYLAAGVSYWKTGDYRMDPEHPPLAKLLAAIPVLFLDVRLPEAGWDKADEDAFGVSFLFDNNLRADRMLLPARLVTVALTLFLGLALALWTRHHFGIPTALLALVFFAFDPNLIAHGRYVTNDMIVALFSFLACVLWGEALVRKSALWSTLAGVAMGCAVASKSTALFLIPVFAILAFIRWPGWKIVAIAPVVGYLVFMATYMPDLITFPAVIPEAYLDGLKFQWQHNKIGHASYLLGHFSDHGWWYYFPIAYLVKAPTALLTLLAAAIVLFAIKRPKLPFQVLVLAIPTAIYWLICLTAHLNLGIRYLLPAYVLTIPLLAIIGVQCAPRWLPLALALLVMVESLAIHPNYLAFFNWPSGGPSNGPRYLLDSNIDWGQDLKKLTQWVNANHTPDVCFAYFGNTPPDYYGLKAQPLPASDETAKIADLNCVAAVSVSPLYGLYVDRDRFRWLRERKPDLKIGYSIYLYDLRRRK